MNLKTIELGPERWSQVERLFEQASQIKANTHRAFLEKECPEDEELRDYVLALLKTGPVEGAAIEKTILNTIASTVEHAFGDDANQDDRMKGELIGPYRVERLLGSGGMGMVYLAERADQQFDQQVAIKVGRHRLVDPQTELRLRNERQILADLDHPNIARLFDGGTTHDGVPYIVMEHIDGVPIDVYCDLHRLNVVERLRLFEIICAAVSHAHQSLVIHRDIKPSNILVTDDSVPKLLDFGIAKIVDEAGTATDGLTREGAVLATPGNAAPEQLLGGTVTTATDVYALGLLLYRLLTGYRAYGSGDLTPREYAHLICYQDVVRPSSRVQHELQIAKSTQDPGVRATFEQNVADRNTTPERLQRRLRGDLDTIILNALRKEPERRYRSVSALAGDIRLHLSSMPITAHADTWRYRTGKFLRRHYAAVSVLALVVAMLIAFTVMLSVQNRIVVKERDTAREVSYFLEDIFKAQDPAQTRGTSITAAEILAAGANRIEEKLGDRPEIQAALMGTIGRVYFNLGEYEPSVKMLEQALKLRLQTDSENSIAVATTQNDLAETLVRRADYERAEMLLNSALATNLKVSGPTSPEVARTLFNLAEVHLKTGEINEAIAFATSSIDIYSAHAEGFSIELAEAKNMLGRILQVSGDLDQAEALLLEAIRIVTDNEGPDHPLMAYYLQNLGVLQRSKGDVDAAEATFERAIVATRRILGEDHHLLAATLVNQGLLLHSRGDLNGGERMLREALALHIKTRGSTHPMVAYDMTALGMVLHDRSQLVAAQDMLRSALQIYAETLDEDHQYTASALTELGAVLNTAGRPDEARPLLERALRIREKDYPADHELVAATRAEYADALSRLGRYDEAEPMLLQSLDALRNQPGRRQQRANDALARLYQFR